MRGGRVVGLGAGILVLVVLVGSSLLGTFAVLGFLIDAGIGVCRTVGPLVEQAVLGTCAAAGRRPLLAGLVIATLGIPVAARAML